MVSIIKRFTCGLPRKIINLSLIGIIAVCNILLGFVRVVPDYGFSPYWIAIIRGQITGNNVPYLSGILILAAFGAIYALCSIGGILKKGNRKSYGMYCVNFVAMFISIVLNSHFNVLEGGSIAFVIVAFILSIIGIAYFALCVIFNREEMFAAPVIEKTEGAKEFEAEEKKTSKKSKKEQVIESVTKTAVKKVEETIEKSEDDEINFGNPKDKHKRLIFIFAGISIVFLFCLIIAPMTVNGSNNGITIWGVLEFGSRKSISSLICFGVVSVLTLISAFRYLYLSLNYRHQKNAKIVETANSIINFNFAFIILATVAGLALTFYQQITASAGVKVTTYSYTVLIPTAILVVCNSVVKSSYRRDIVFYDINDAMNDAEKKREAPIKAIKRPQLSRGMLFYAVLFTLLPFALFATPLLKIHAVNGDVVVLDKTFSAWNYLINVGGFDNAIENIISLAIVILVALSGILLLFTITAYAKKEKIFYKIAGAVVVTNFVYIGFISLFGLFFSMSKDLIIELVKHYVIVEVTDVTATSSSYMVFVVAAVLLVSLLIVNPMKNQHIYDEFDNQQLFTSLANARQIVPETIGDIVRDSLPEFDENGNLKNPEDAVGTNGLTQKEPLDVSIVEKQQKDVILPTFDACPSFTEIDSKEDQFNAALDIRNKFLFPEPSLNALVKFVVNYAANSRLHLSYTFEDIASFVAGLGCTRLTILQGMSGTGKTSLPKIFMEALYGNCELVEIESSWREKNELLGFYNEFSKVYTPKKFTQLLYKAALNPNVVTMIVLDEMNLSRIEYYFSDFLSLMENEEDKRQIKLTNVKLYNTYNNERHSYKKLVEDHTLKIPTNVWFIGTANRDESTFEISDKVYDRAHTMNFNKRAEPITKFGASLKPQFMTYETFSELLNKAKKSYKFDIEKNDVIKRVEKILSPYNISFGNRIYKQIIEYVAVYCSCFKDPKKAEFEAVERILLTKVVMKLENKNIDRKQQLIAEFQKLKLMKCVDFISKLSEDF